MKRLSAILLISTTVLFFAACGSNKTDSVDQAKDMNEQKSDSTGADSLGTLAVSESDANWAVKAANGGMMEVELGRYAQEHATTKAVKDFGSMMVQDHSAANDQLKGIARTKNITLPDSVSNATRNDMNDLMKKTGKDFDKAYINMMVDDHKSDINDYQDGVKNLTNTELKNFAQNTLPTLQKHLAEAERIKSQNKY